MASDLGPISVLFFLHFVVHAFILQRILVSIVDGSQKLGCCKLTHLIFLLIQLKSIKGLF